jgi:hypothetical protein
MRKIKSLGWKYRQSGCILVVTCNLCALLTLISQQEDLPDLRHKGLKNYTNLTDHGTVKVTFRNSLLLSLNEIEIASTETKERVEHSETQQHSNADRTSLQATNPEPLPLAGDVEPRSASLAWLALCVLTAPRGNVSYLINVLKTIADQQFDSDSNSTSAPPNSPPIAGPVPQSAAAVLVLDIETGAIPIAANATPATNATPADAPLAAAPLWPARADVAAARSLYPQFRIGAMRGRVREKCRLAEWLGDLGRPGNVSCAVRQQTRDIAAGLAQCAAAAPQAAWIVVVEDDTPVCPGAPARP